MKREQIVSNTFGQMKMREDTTEEILAKVLEYKKEVQKDIKWENEERGTNMAKHEIKPDNKRVSERRIAAAFAAAAATVAIIAGGITFLKMSGSGWGNEGISSSVTTSLTEGENQSETASWKEQDENNPGSNYRYVYKAVYNEEADDYDFYTGKTKTESKNGADTVIRVEGEDILNKNFTRADEDTIDVESFSDMWIYVSYDGKVLDKPKEDVIFAKNIILCGKSIPKAMDYDKFIRKYPEISTFLSLSNNATESEISSIYQTWEKDSSWEGMSFNFDNDTIFLSQNDDGTWNKLMQMQFDGDTEIITDDFSQEDANSVKKGMTYEEVEKLLGKGDGVKICIYDGYYDKTDTEVYVERMYTNTDFTVYLWVEFSLDGIVQNIVTY